jgi:Asp-tRNA(Asn)/Glu-tRNA(Gln) amidotransferase C subunit
MSYPDKFNLESGSESDSDNIYSQPNPYSHLKQDEKEEADKKINEFDDYIKKLFEVYLESLGDEDINEENYTADEIELENSEGNDEANFFYFIGRLNPPHDGHIFDLKELVNKAMSKGSKALILLGSGPKQADGDKRTFENPIPFELKKEFIEQQLQSIGANEGTNYIIQEMSTPHGDLARYIGESLKSKNVSDIKEIKINHFAGGKDEDATKLKSILDFASKVAASENPGASISTNVVVIEPKPNESGLKPMSATQVRKDAFKTYLDGSGYNGWLKQYKDFYGTMGQQVYEEILYPIYKLRSSGLSDEEIQNFTRDYIETGKLPKASKKTVKKRGGSKRGGTKRKQKNGKRKSKRLNKLKNNKRITKIVKRKYKLVTR